MTATFPALLHDLSAPARAFVPDLGLGGGLAVWGLRDSIKGGAPLSHAFRAVLDADADAALFALRRIAEGLDDTGAAWRARPGALWTTARETHVLDAIAALQAGWERRAGPLLNRAFGGVAPDRARDGAASAARIFAGRGLILPLAGSEPVLPAAA